MLTLADSRRIGAFMVYRDVVFRGGERALTGTFYALPDAPRIAREDDGGPSLRFLWYRQLDAASGGAISRGGGLLTVTIELGPTADERADLTRALAVATGIDPAEVRLLAVPISSGEVSLTFAGEASGDLVNATAGSGSASLVGAERASFAIDLSSDGAALLASALERGLDLLLARYDLAFEYHLDAVELRVWCDVARAAAVSALHGAAGLPDPSKLREGLEASQAAGVEILAGAELPAEQRDALVAMGRKILDDALASASVTPPDGADGAPGAGALAARLSAASRLNATFTMACPAEARAVFSTLLATELTPAQREARIVRVDVTDALRPMEITAICSVDFATDLVVAVHLFVEYSATTDDGTRIERADDHLFDAASSQRVFRFDAASRERRYRRRVTVHYRGGASVDLEAVVDDATLLVLDLGGLGVLDVEVALGDARLDVVRAVLVDLEYPSQKLAEQVILDGERPSARWQIITGDRERAPWRARATWITADGRRVEDAWRAVAGGRAILDAPRSLGVATSVLAIAAGDFADTAQILVELRTGPDPGAQQIELAFTRAGESHAWQPNLAAGAPLRYQARRTIITADGVVRALGWTDEEAPLLIVRDEQRREVQIVPRLLDLGPDRPWTLAILTLEHDDPELPAPQRTSLLLRSRDVEVAWSFRAGSPDRRSFRHQLTLVPKDGARRAGPLQESDTEVLVLLTPGNEE